MSKAVTSVDYCAGILLDCGHKTFIRMSESPSRGDEVDCPVCPIIAPLQSETAVLKSKLQIAEGKIEGQIEFAKK